jgi:hypothetical protein
MTEQSSTEARLAQRQRLEACARWNERQAYLHRKNGYDRDSDRHHNNAMSCRLRQR